jgi:peptidoglycan-associated lipoprotein
MTHCSKPARKRAPATLIIAALALSACAHQQAESTPPAQPVSQPTAAQNSNATNASASASIPCTADKDCQETQLCATDHCVEVSAAVQECSSTHVHFSFNSAQLPDNEKQILTRAARCLRADRGMNIMVEGNADERGTEEYNLALGDQRATAVAKYLTALGASKAQLKTVSYGKNQPLCTEHDEDCWAKNRRAGLKVGEAGDEKHDLN